VKRIKKFGLIKEGVTRKKFTLPTILAVAWIITSLLGMSFLPLRKENLESSTLNLAFVKEKILGAGDNKIHGFAYYDGYLWASTRTSPGRILKIDPPTLDYQRIILDRGLNNGEDLISAEGYIWVILHTSPSKIIKIDPNTLDWEIAVAFKSGEVGHGGSLEYAFGYLWAGGYGKIAKIDLDNLRYQIYDYSGTVGNTQFHALVSGGNYIWGSCPCSSLISQKTDILRINPSNPTQYDWLRLDELITDDMVYINDNLYAGTESEWKSSHVYKISNDLTFTKGITHNTKCYGIFYHQANGLWGTHEEKPGKLIKFDLDLTLKGVYNLPNDFNHANEIVFDEIGNIYVTCWESPAKIVKLTPNRS